MGHRTGDDAEGLAAGQSQEIAPCGGVSVTSTRLSDAARLGARATTAFHGWAGHLCLLEWPPPECPPEWPLGALM